MDFRAFWILKFGLGVVNWYNSLYKYSKIQKSLKYAIFLIQKIWDKGYSTCIVFERLWDCIHMLQRPIASLFCISGTSVQQDEAELQTQTPSSLPGLKRQHVALFPTGLQGSRPFEWPPYATLLVTGSEEKQSGRFPSAVKCGSLEMALLLAIHLLELLTTSGQFCSIAGKGENKKYFVSHTD